MTTINTICLNASVSMRSVSIQSCVSIQSVWQTEFTEQTAREWVVGFINKDAVRHLAAINLEADIEGVGAHIGQFTGVDQPQLRPRTAEAEGAR